MAILPNNIIITKHKINMIILAILVNRNKLKMENNGEWHSPLYTINVKFEDKLCKFLVDSGCNYATISKSKYKELKEYGIEIEDAGKANVDCASGILTSSVKFMKLVIGTQEIKLPIVISNSEKYDGSVGGIFLKALCAEINYKEDTIILNMSEDLPNDNSVWKMEKIGEVDDDSDCRNL